MNINYIPLGSFCHPKIHIRNSNREILKSLPFDFHSTPNTYSIYSILNKLSETKTFKHNFKEIIFEHEHNQENKKELAVSDDEDMFFLHFFDKSDKINDNDDYPISVDNNLDKEKMDEVSKKFQDRYEYLYKILNSTKNILVFLRIENYNNTSWKIDVKNLVESLKKYKNPNKFLIYTQIEIDENLDFYNSFKINYDFNFPIIFHKILFNENISSNENDKKAFENILLNVEKIINNCFFIKFNKITEIYYHDNTNKILLNLNNLDKIYKIENFNNYKLELKFNNELLILLKNSENIYELIS